MERRNFMKTLMVAMVIPYTKRTVGMSSLLIDVDHNKWMEDNWEWLSKWLFGVRPCAAPELIGGWHPPIKTEHVLKKYLPVARAYQQYTQIFKNRIHPACLSGPDKFTLHEHICGLLFFSVFGRKSISSLEGRISRSMSGFVELTGRLPTEDDDVHLEWIPDRRMKYSECADDPLNEERYFISECALVV